MSSETRQAILELQQTVEARENELMRRMKEMEGALATRVNQLERQVQQLLGGSTAFVPPPPVDADGLGGITLCDNPDCPE